MVGQGYDFDGPQVVVGANVVADTCGVYVLGQEVNDKDVRREFLHDGAGLEIASNDPCFVAGLVLQVVGESGSGIAVAVNDEDAKLADGEGCGGDVVNLNKPNKLADGDSSILAAGNAIALELAVIEPLRDRARRDVADFGHFAGCQYVLAFCHRDIPTLSSHLIRRYIRQWGAAC